MVGKTATFAVCCKEAKRVCPHARTALRAQKHGFVLHVPACLNVINLTVRVSSCFGGGGGGSLCAKGTRRGVFTQKGRARFKLDSEHFTQHDTQDAIKHLGKLRNKTIPSRQMVCDLLARYTGNLLWKSAGTSAKSRVVSQDNNNPLTRSTI